MKPSSDYHTHAIDIKPLMCPPLNRIQMLNWKISALGPFKGGDRRRPRKRFSVEQIINHLRESEVLLAQGKTVGDICRRIRVSEQSYYRWRREYGGLKVDQARRLKELEQENARLKRAIADLTLDKPILNEAAEGNR